MTESEWLSTYPTLMMSHIKQVSPASARKLRLLAVAYAKFLETKPDYADAKHVAHLGDAVVEGVLTLDELWDDRIRGWGYDGDWSIANCVLAPDEQIDQAFRKAVVFSEDSGQRSGGVVSDRPATARSLILCVLGNPFRPAALNPSWVTSTVLDLAQGIYSDRAHDRLPILADALEEAGCDRADILTHCRGPGPHVRGCWVVDMLLGKE